MQTVFHVKKSPEISGEEQEMEEMQHNFMPRICFRLYAVISISVLHYEANYFSFSFSV